VPDPSTFSIKIHPIPTRPGDNAGLQSATSWRLTVKDLLAKPQPYRRHATARAENPARTMQNPVISAVHHLRFGKFGDFWRYRVG
jgi:hypothetical protein